MANRFDTSQQQQYISSYVPLPFQEIGALGANMQQKYDSNIADSYKLNDLMAQVPAIHDPQLGLSNIAKKQQLDAKYHLKIQALIDKIVAGDPNASRELEQVKREFINDPDRQELENSYLNYKAYKEDKTKKGGKYDPLLDDYHGQQLIGEDGSLKPFRYSGMEDSLDIESRFSKAMDGIKDDVKGWDVEHIGPDGIKIGDKGKRAGITPDKVLGIAKTKVSDMLRLTDEGKQFVKKLRKLNPGISDNQIIDEGIKALFSSASEQIGTEKTDGNSVSLTDMWSRNQKKQENIDNISNSSSIEGNTFTIPDEDLKSLKDKNIFTEVNGKLSFNINELNKFKNLDYRAFQGINLHNSKDVNEAIKKSVYSSGSTPDDNSKQFLKQLVKMSIATGRDISKLPKESTALTQEINKITEDYTNLLKSRSVNLLMNKDESIIASSLANRNIEKITFLDPKDGKSLKDKSEYEISNKDKIQITNRKTNSDGMTYEEGNLLKEDGSTIPIAIKSPQREKNIIFDNLGKLEKRSIDNLTKEKPEYLKTKEGNPIVNTMNGVSRNLESSENVGQNATIQSYVNPKNRQDVLYVFIDPNGYAHPSSSLEELQKKVKKHYYSTPEGQGELKELATSNTLFKEQ